MRILKTFRKPKLAGMLAFLILFMSCSQHDNIQEDNSIIDFDTALRNFKITYQSVKPRIKEIEEYKINNYQSKSMNNEMKLAFEPLIKPSLDLFKSANFSEKDMIEMLGEKYSNNINTAAIGVMFYEVNHNINKSKNSKNHAITRVNPVIECFNEATGIAAGVALVAALAGQATGKAVRKAFIKFIKKIGIKTAAGIGLILMAAEFVWCLSQGDLS